MSSSVTLVLVGENPGAAFAHHSELSPFSPENPWDLFVEDIPLYQLEIRRIASHIGQAVMVRDAEKHLTREVMKRVSDCLEWQDLSITLLFASSLQTPLRFNHLDDSVVVYRLCSGELEHHPFTFGVGV